MSGTPEAKLTPLEKTSTLFEAQLCVAEYCDYVYVTPPGSNRSSIARSASALQEGSVVSCGRKGQLYLCPRRP